MDKINIKREGDKYYMLFFLERGKPVLEGIVTGGDFDDLEETEGLPWNTLVYTRNGNGLDFKRGDYDLMIETIGKYDYNSYKNYNFSANTFKIYQIEKLNLKTKYNDPRYPILTSTDYLTVKFEKSWPDCKIKGGNEFEALITGIRRDISLRKLSI